MPVAGGGAGVIIAGQNGPGAANLITGLAQAQAAYSPAVTLAGSLSSAHAYRDAFQEVDQTALFRPVTKKTWLVPHASRIGELTLAALRTATTPRCGPVVLNLPRDLLAATVDHSPAMALPGRQADGACAANPALVERAARLLAGAERPLILAGGGVKNGRHADVTLRLAEMLAAPVVTSPGHGDAVPCTPPLYGGQVGPRGNAVATSLAREADVILALGTRLGFNTTFYTYDHLNPAARIIQVEIEPTAIGRFFPVEIGIHADAGLAAAALVAELGRHAASPRHGTAAQLFRALRAVAPPEAMYTMDAGTLCLQATDQLNYALPPALFTPLDFGLVGFSYACGLGVKLAAPRRPVISLMGDGGFGMTASEIGTAVANVIATVCIVMNNGCWGAEKAYQRDFFGGRYLGADVPNPPYDRLAELWGAAGSRVDRADQLEPVFAAALAAGRRWST